MANPRYHDDPEWYERPGETVHLEVDQHPSMFTVPELPWQSGSMSRIAELRRESRTLVLRAETVPCITCTKPTTNPNRLCNYCARSQARDETFRARTNQPQPSRPRIAIREGWEAWSESQPKAESDPDLESGHVRPYETRIG